MTTARAVSLSVIIPVRNAAGTLPECLLAVGRSRYPREQLEVIVVDDASTDDSAIIAAGYADTVVRLPHVARGPAYARNRGAELARGDTLVFIDADVRVRSDTFDRFVIEMRQWPGAMAISASYDALPSTSGFVADYRNVLRHLQQQRRAGQGVFWAGCAAVRRHSFLAAGMFDEWRFPRPQIEDLDLARRLAAAGGTVVQLPDIQVSHLKHWSLRAMLRTDFRDRALPWMRLGMPLGAPRDGRSGPWDASELTAIGATLLATVAATAATFGAGRRAAVAALLLGATAILAQGATYASFIRLRGPLFALRAIGLQLLSHLAAGSAIITGWTAYHVLGEPRPDPLVEALAEVGHQSWPPVPRFPARPAAQSARVP